jgi:bifunctional DNA-binding transcriptional regulator/antitoxin component of YhaV-PrlF toxin-antitoxin module
MSYILEVQEDDNGDLFITFPDDLIEELGWEEDDILEWNIKGDGVVLSRLNEMSGYEVLED